MVHLPIFEKLSFPDNARSVSGELIELATFEAINTGDLVDQHVFEEVPGEPLNMALESVGYEQTEIVLNSSVIVWTIIIYAFLLVILYPLVYLINGELSVCKAVKRNLRDHLFEKGTLVRILLETYTEVLLTGLINVS